MFVPTWLVTFKTQYMGVNQPNFQFFTTICGNHSKTNQKWDSYIKSPVARVHDGEKSDNVVQTRKRPPFLENASFSISS